MNQIPGTIPASEMRAATDSIESGHCSQRGDDWRTLLVQYAEEVRKANNLPEFPPKMRRPHGSGPVPPANPFHWLWNRRKRRFREGLPGTPPDSRSPCFTTVRFPEAPKGKFYFHVNGLRDIPTFQRTEQQSDLYVNGKKLPAPVGIYNGYLGGPGARLWEFDADRLLKAGENRIALRVYNSSGAGGIDKLPVRLERKGKNLDFLLPYEFRRSKYTNHFFWCW